MFRLPKPARRLLQRRVHLFPTDEVTTASPREVDPALAGAPGADRDAIWRSVVDFYNMGLHPAIGVCVMVRGQVLIDRAIGHARGNAPGDPRSGPKQLATPDTLFNLFSASKIVTAMLVHHAASEGLIHLDDPVQDYIQGFGRHGKHGITIRHVLTHRAGIPTIPTDKVDLDLLMDSEAIVSALCDAPLTSEPGRTLAYHALTGGFVLAAVLEQVTGKPLRELLREVVVEPLGLEPFSYGVRPERLGDVALEAFTGPTPRSPFKRMLSRSLGVPMRKAVELTNDDRFRTGVVPSGNLITTPYQAARFMEMLRCGGTLDGVRVFGARTVRRAVAEQSYREIDKMLMLPIRYSAGFMLGGEHLSFYGPGTPAAFGHLGFTNVLIYADPERELAVAFLNNGKPFITGELLLWQNVMWTIAGRLPRRAVA